MNSARRSCGVALSAAVLLLCAGCAVAAGSPPPPGDTGAPTAPGRVGVPPGTPLRDTATLRVDRPGTVVDGVRVRGMVTVTAPGVVIRNSEFIGDGTQPWAIRTTGSGSVSIEDVTIRGDYTDSAISYANWSADRVEIVGMTNDAAKVGANVTVRHSWLHGFLPSAGAHADGLQVVEDVGHVDIEDNVIDVGTADGANSAVFLSPDIGPDVTGAGPITVRRNLLGGGSYSVYVVGGQRGAVLDDVHLLDNRFQRDARYGAIREDRPPAQDVGNTYVDGGPVTRS